VQAHATKTVERCQAPFVLWYNGGMPIISKRILTFALVFFGFVLLPGFFTMHPGFYPMLEWADFIDLMSPLFVIPAYWFLFRLDDNSPPSRKETFAFVMILVVFMEGHGMHLTANAIGHVVKDLAPTPPFSLTYFFDEFLGHYLWNFGVLAFSTLLMIRNWHQPTPKARSTLYVDVTAGVFYGFTFFASLIEGNTAPLSLPYALLAVAYAAGKTKGKFERFPVLRFFTVAHVFALVLTTIWFLYWKGLPEFSEVGILSGTILPGLRRS